MKKAITKPLNVQGIPGFSDHDVSVYSMARIKRKNVTYNMGHSMLLGNVRA